MKKPKPPSKAVQAIVWRLVKSADGYSTKAASEAVVAAYCIYLGLAAPDKKEAIAIVNELLIPTFKESFDQCLSQIKT